MRYRHRNMRLKSVMTGFGNRHRPVIGFVQPPGKQPQPDRPRSGNHADMTAFWPLMRTRLQGILRRTQQQGGSGPGGCLPGDCTAAQRCTQEYHPARPGPAPGFQHLQNEQAPQAMTDQMNTAGIITSAKVLKAHGAALQRHSCRAIVKPLNSETGPLKASPQDPQPGRAEPQSVDQNDMGNLMSNHDSDFLPGSRPARYPPGAQGTDGNQQQAGPDTGEGHRMTLRKGLAP